MLDMNGLNKTVVAIVLARAMAELIGLGNIISTQKSA